MQRNLAGIIGVLMIAVTLFSPTLQARLYRWVTDDGQVHYSDKIPPKQAQRERKVFDDEGNLIATVEAPKLKKQTEAEQKQAALEDEKRKKQQQQAKFDQGLLSTFSSIQQLKTVRDDRLKIIESMLANLENKLTSLGERQSQLERDEDAAKENQGPALAKIKKHQQRVRFEIDSVTEQRTVQAKKKRETEERFESYIKRFAELKGD
ncbi:MAG: DUF4124 domain-containing protein [Gammaproteobacteria bacterium]|nr:DUF4124 domain-containing protein [Gammaproteobacteria bacterium]